ncbi:13410_t:CDS:2, partial [Racocetra persica]
MVYEADFPQTPEAYQDIIVYLQNGHLYAQIKNQPLCRFVPVWDLEFRQSLLKQFHNNDRHINANDCHKKIMEIEVQETLTTSQIVKDHLEKVSIIHNEVNKQLKKTRKRMQKIQVFIATKISTNLAIGLTNNNKTIVVELSE